MTPVEMTIEDRNAIERARAILAGPGERPELARQLARIRDAFDIARALGISSPGSLR